LYSAYRQYNSTTKRSDVDFYRVTCKYTTSAFPSYKQGNILIENTNIRHVAQDRGRFQLHKKTIIH